MGKSSINKPIGASGMLANRPQSNLIHVQKSKFFTTKNILILAALGTILLAGLYFGVISRYRDILIEQNKLNAANEMLEDVKAHVNERYDEVAAEYAKHDRSFIAKSRDSEQFANIINRVDLIEKVEKLLGDKLSISNIKITGNDVNFDVSNVSIKVFADVQNELKKVIDEGEIGLVEVATGPYLVSAGTDAQGESYVKVGMTLTFK